MTLGGDNIQPVPQRHRLHNGVDLVKAVFTPTMQLQKKVYFGRCVDAELVTVLTNKHGELSLRFESFELRCENQFLEVAQLNKLRFKDRPRRLLCPLNELSIL